MLSNGGGVEGARADGVDRGTDERGERVAARRPKVALHAARGAPAGGEIDAAPAHDVAVGPCGRRCERSGLQELVPALGRHHELAGAPPHTAVGADAEHTLLFERLPVRSPGERLDEPAVEGHVAPPALRAALVAEGVGRRGEDVDEEAEGGVPVLLRDAAHPLAQEVVLSAGARDVGVDEAAGARGFVRQGLDLLPLRQVGGVF